jgi:ADP-ribose pyrophosphatase YjhB (NUDIX family)
MSAGNRQPDERPGEAHIESDGAGPAGAARDDHKQSISLVIRNWARPEQLLLVQRPHDDDSLPGVWGLPAATLRLDESWADAGRRIGPEKLGVTLHMGRELNRGGRMQRGHTMEMRLFEATILRGLPSVPQNAGGVTQYRQWRWDAAEALRPGALQGSLCCMLQLDLMAREARVRAKMRERDGSPA